MNSPRRWYLGKIGIKNTGVDIEYTPDMLEEYQKCATDAKYFINNYCYIIALGKGKIKFKLRGYQEQFIDLILNNRFVISKQPRQSGKSETLASLLLWFALFHNDFSIAIAAHKEKQAREILARTKLAFENLPEWLQQGVKEWNKGNIEFENGSSIKIYATSSGSLRGTTHDIVYADELAHVEKNLQDEFYESTYPVISSGDKTKFIITSTPNGMDLFYKIWEDSRNGKNSFKRFEISWRDVPGRDDAWMMETIKNTSVEKFRREYGCEFLGSTNTLIDPNKLQTLVSQKPTAIEGNLTVFKKPQEGHSYIVCCDCSEGLNQDYHAAVVVDVSQVPYEVCAVWHNNTVSHMLLPNYLYDLCQTYNEAVIMIEVQSTGAAVAANLLYDLEYEGVLRTVTKANKGQKVGGGVTARLGVMMNKQVKRIGCVNLKTIIERDKLILNDERIIKELYTFIADKNSFAAQEGHHDDLVMSLVIFAWMANQDYFKDLFESDVRRNLYEENAEAISSDFIPFGFIDNHTGIEEEEEQVELQWSQLIL